ncbi:TetR family transcriptional regulator [Nonomuraea phyllanthi]|uniref:TetR/AcrR family transcriptional regulator n=1 Tax=Nonomuraea phyllanthi TaxID=2219224 RepID=UPI001293BF3A|nr:TetR/AcrR family transcriptional regulator [Nonomuraea phyllanthi]QFY07596.1 TetR family transcriptional regulator [Nonomuraea phyllanthi]
MSAATSEGRRPARTRILETAARLFYSEGVHAVGIDRIIAEASVAKATFYHHFPGKDDLVRAYVNEQSAAQRATVAAMGIESPRERLHAVFTYMCDFGSGPGYRGCPFVNTSAEYPDPAHPVRQAIAEHRRWNRDLYRDLLAADGHPDAERTADILLLLRDGIAVGFEQEDHATVRTATEEALARVLR